MSTGCWAAPKRLPPASTIGCDRLPDPVEPGSLRDFAERCLEIGYPAYKMHGWHEGDVAEDLRP